MSSLKIPRIPNPDLFSWELPNGVLVFRNDDPIGDLPSDLPLTLFLDEPIPTLELISKLRENLEELIIYYE